MSDASPRVLISYRRDDTAGHAGRIYDRLAAALGPSSLFMDIEGIAAGHDFTRAIRTAVESCHVLVAVIGREWLDIRDAQGKRRLDDPNDWVRLEIATALQRDIVVIPVLVEGARMPDDRELPSDLVPLAKRQALEVSDTRFNSDVERLVAAIRGEKSPVPRTWPKPSAVGLTAAGLVAVAGLGYFAATRPRPAREAATQPPVVRSFTVEPSRYIATHIDAVQLSWNVEGVTEVRIGDLGPQPPQGARTVAAPSSDTSFRLTAQNARGDARGEAAVDVMTLDEFITVDTPSASTKQQITSWLSDFLRSLEQIGYLPDIRRVIVVVDPKLKDNAYFDGERMVIGGPLAGDRDVVLREYCHLMLTGDEAAGRSGRRLGGSPAMAALESALADYLPASTQDDPRIGEVAGPPVWKLPYIRTLINATKFSEVTADDAPQRAGEPWAGAFWDMRLAFGRAVVDRLLLDAWFGMEPVTGSQTGSAFVRRLLDLSASDAPRAARIRSILQQREFPSP